LPPGTYTDADCPGLQVRVKEDGRRSFVFRYRAPAQMRTNVHGHDSFCFQRKNDLERRRFN
jgi:hypothetical protein